MISIKETEQQIKEMIDPAVLSPKYSIPGFKIRVYPGEQEDLGKVIHCNTVQVKFKDISYKDYDGLKYGKCCVGLECMATFNILIQSNDLRKHTDVYEIAEAVIVELRGTCIGVQRPEADIQNSTPVHISSYTFDKVDNGGACYQSSIDISFRFTDIYHADKCHIKSA